MFQRPVNRIAPKMGPESYKTYEVASPLETHTRPATCHEIDCERYHKGWSTVLDVSDPKHARVANWIRMLSGRKFTFTQHGFIVVFHFPPGQQCFTPHRISLQRPELYLVKGGDWRGNPHNIETYKHRGPENWVEDFATHQDKLATRFNQG